MALRMRMARVRVGFALLLLGIGTIWAQQEEAGTPAVDAPGEILGTVTAPDTSRLPGVEIKLKGTSFSTITDDIGSFTLTGVPTGRLTIVASLSGFLEKETAITVYPGQTVTVEIVLGLAAVETELTVSPDSPQLMSASENIGVVDVQPRQLAALPRLGESDIFRSLQLMPGMSASNEASSGLFVRGGTPDQNLVLFDGFTVYDVDHLFGIFSAFNPNAVENVTMSKGGYESKYGERLSSVVDMTGRTGRNGQPSLGAGISFLTFNGYADMPLGSKGGFMLAGRKSFQSPFSDRIRDTYSDAGPSRSPGGRGFEGFTTDPELSFYDVNARGVFRPTMNDDLVFSLYHGKDNLDNSRALRFVLPPVEEGADEEDSEGFREVTGEIVNVTDWGNTGASGSWSRNWNDSLFTRVTFGHSRYFKDYERRTALAITGSEEDGNGEEGPVLAGGAGENNRLEDYTLKVDSHWVISPKHGLGFGALATRNEANYEFALGNDLAAFDQFRQANTYAVYIQDTWRPFHKLSITPGIRPSYYDVTQETYFDPRLAVVFHINDKLRLKASGGQYHQFANRLIREDPLGGDQDFWMMSDGDLIPVGDANHYIAGVSYETQGFLVDVEAYRKELSGLSEFASLRPRGEDWEEIELEERFYTGTGEAEGVELLFQKKFGRNTGWVTYTLGRVDYLFPDISENPFSASHDSKHEFKIVDTHRWRNFIFAGSFIYATGKPYTEVTGIEEVTLPSERTLQLPILGEKNALRLPSYQRLDLSASWNFWRAESSQATAGVSFFNVLDHKNVWRKEYDVVGDELIETDVNYLGFTISAFLNVDFTMAAPGSNAGPVSKAAVSGASAATVGAAADSGEKSKEEKIYDFYGTVESMDSRSLVVNSKWGSRTLMLDDATIKGASSYDPGTNIHVFYKVQGDDLLVTMVFRRIS